MTKTIYFKTFGCKVNQYETQGMRENLLLHGFQEIDQPERAHYVIVNSCTVTHHSDRKALYYIRRFRKTNPQGTIVVTGCLTENDDPHMLYSRGADIVLRNEHKMYVAQRILAHDTRAVSVPQETPSHAFSISSFKGHSRAFVKIQDGCTMNCSYCKVRIVRGKSRSRTLFDIRDEVKKIVGNGYKEIVLTGVELGAYGKDLVDTPTLVTLLDLITPIAGLERVRLSSIEPFDVTHELIAYMAYHKKICPHFHIPLQSGDDTILKAMRRGCTSNQYRELIQTIRKAIPHCALTTDIIVGFPGEGDSAFANTIALLKETQPFKIHFFPFSPRKETDAYWFTGRVPHRIIKMREDILKKLNTTLFKSSSDGLRGQVYPVLLEKEGTRDGQQVRGRLPDYRVVVIKKAHPDFLNSIVPVLITGCYDDHLAGEVMY